MKGRRVNDIEAQLAVACNFVAYEDKQRLTCEMTGRYVEAYWRPHGKRLQDKQASRVEERKPGNSTVCKHTDSRTVLPQEDTSAE